MERLRERQRVRDADGARSTTRDPSGRHHRPRAAACPRRGPGRPGRLAGGQPRRARRARHPDRQRRRVLLRRPAARLTSTSSASTRAAPVQSHPVDCLTDEELDAFVASDPGSRRPGRGPASSSQRLEDFFAGCAENSGERRRPRLHQSRRPATWTCCAPRSARTQLSYFGFSYGTRLGATYAELFPDQVGRFVLDGATDPRSTLRESSLEPGRRLPGRAGGLPPELRRRGRLLPRRHRRRRVSTGSASCSTRSTTSRCRPATIATWRSATPSTG